MKRSELSFHTMKIACLSEFPFDVKSYMKCLFLYSNNRMDIPKVLRYMIRALNIMRKFPLKEFITLTLQKKKERRRRRKHPFQSSNDNAFKILSPFFFFELVDSHSLLFLPPIECSFRILNYIIKSNRK